jgi:hypothetical protein
VIGVIKARGFKLAEMPVLVPQTGTGIVIPPNQSTRSGISNQ